MMKKTSEYQADKSVIFSFFRYTNGKCRDECDHEWSWSRLKNTTSPDEPRKPTIFCILEAVSMVSVLMLGKLTIMTVTSAKS